MMHTNPNASKLLRRLFFGATFAGCLFAAAGCASNELHGEDFDGPTVQRANGTYLQSQAAASAAKEGALQEQDFSNDTLDSLGQVELDLMVKGTPPTQPVVVHLEFPTPPDADALATRENSASAYLQDRGVPKSQIQFVEGPNGKLTRTAAMLPFAYKGDNGNFNGGMADDGGGSTLSAAGQTK